MIRVCTLALVDFAMAAQVGYDGEVSTAALGFAGVGLFAGVAVHVGLERGRAGESLVADLALVFLLCAGGDFGVELAHH